MFLTPIRNCAWVLLVVLAISGDAADVKSDSLKKHGSSKSSITSKDLAPPPVENFRATERTPTSILFSWSLPSVTVNGYEFDSGVTSVYIENTTTSWNMTNLEPGSMVTVKIAAYVTVNGEAVTSERVVVNETTLWVPPPVQNFRATGATPLTVTFSWDAPSEPVNGFELDLGLTNLYLVNDSTSWNFTNLHPRHVVSVNISAYVIQDGQKLRSKKVSATGTSSDCNPSVPQDLQISDLTSSGFRVSWSVPEITNGRTANAVDGYRLSISGSGEAYSQNTTDLSHVYEGLVPETKYQIFLQAFNSFDQYFCISVPETITVTTKPKLNAGAIFGIIFGSICLVSAGVFVAYRFYKIKKQSAAIEGLMNSSVTYNRS